MVERGQFHIWSRWGSQEKQNDILELRAGSERGGVRVAQVLPWEPRGQDQTRCRILEGEFWSILYSSDKLTT